MRLTRAKLSFGCGKIKINNIFHVENQLILLYLTFGFKFEEKTTEIFSLIEANAYLEILVASKRRHRVQLYNNKLISKFYISN